MTSEGDDEHPETWGEFFKRHRGKQKGRKLLEVAELWKQLKASEEDDS